MNVFDLAVDLSRVNVRTTKHPTYIQVQQNIENETSGICTKNKIDITNYSKLCVEYIAETYHTSIYASVYGVLKNIITQEGLNSYNNYWSEIYKPTGYPSRFAITTPPLNETRTLEIDIADLVGSYYVEAKMYYMRSGKILKVWLE